jgi:hypothetical protein
MALPHWLDEVPNIDFAREKQTLLDILAWGETLGWGRIDTQGLEFNARKGTDLALEKDGKKLRVAVQPKSRNTSGMIRIQAIPTFREAVIVWQPRNHRWEIELGGVPLDRTWDEGGFGWLLSRLFAG